MIDWKQILISVGIAVAVAAIVAFAITKIPGCSQLPAVAVDSTNYKTIDSLKKSLTEIEKGQKIQDSIIQSLQNQHTTNIVVYKDKKSEILNTNIDSNYLISKRELQQWTPADYK